MLKSKNIVALFITVVILGTSVLGAPTHGKKNTPVPQGVSVEEARVQAYKLREKFLVKKPGKKSATLDDCQNCHDGCVTGSLTCIAISALSGCAPCALVCLAGQTACHVICNRGSSCRNAIESGTEN